MRETDLHIGQLVKSVVKSRGIKDVDFARMINRSKQNVYDLYKRNDMEVKLLLTCSRVLQHNFFEDIYPAAQIEREKIVDEVLEVIKQKLKEAVKE